MPSETSGGGKHAAETDITDNIDSYDVAAVALWYDALCDAGWSHDLATGVIVELYDETVPASKRELYAAVVEQICLARSGPALQQRARFVGIVKMNE